MKQIQQRKAKGFTLIEILLVMALLAMLALLLIGSFSATLKKGRDQQRKNDLSQLQKALEFYYEDKNTYPTFDIIAPNSAKKFCSTTSCYTNETIYMYKTPKDPSFSSYVYKYVPGSPPSYYYLYSYIENELDQGSTVGQAGFSSGVKCDAAGSINCKYYVSSPNAVPLTPNPTP